MSRTRLTATRIRWILVVLTLIFGAISLRLVSLALVRQELSIEGVERALITASRPPIVDRNGLELALDIRVPSLFAEPRNIIDVDEAIEKLRLILPELDASFLRSKLSNDRGFVWIKRELTPAIQTKIMQLGLPGIDFVYESRRYYPGGSEASHVLGAVNIDNQGIAGMEKVLDDQGLALLQEVGLARNEALTPVQLSLDLRVQHAMRVELLDALNRYQAVAAAGVILDVATGEVLALSSVPDFDPNDPSTALSEGSLNRITAGKFELGSVFKIVTLAASLDSGKVRITDAFDARFGVRFGRYLIDDFHGKRRVLSVPEVFKYSSNIGAIRIMQALGKDEFRRFLTKIGFDARVPIELPETTRSSIPLVFSDVGAATSSFGQGLSITPLHMAAAVAAFMNDGRYVPPTLFRRSSEEAGQLGRPLIAPSTSAYLRYLMRLNSTEGSGTRANKIAEGYRLGTKTGTAQKVVNGRYSSDSNFNVFVSAFPMERPRYVLLVLVDDPQPENEQSDNTAGWNAGEVSGRIVALVAPMLGVAPSAENIDAALLPQELAVVAY